MEIMVTTVTLGAPDASALAAFYRDLLGGEVVGDDPSWVVLRTPRSGVGIAFQQEDEYRAPVWPEQPGEQQMMVHLEIRVDDLDDGVAHALACGATLASYQPQDDVRVCVDPAGHPFCLWVES
jgi:catechol 2,3-dioxygenase-like lactoylglutathione lyase family enzyme